MLRKWISGIILIASFCAPRTVAADKIDFDQGVDVPGVVDSLKLEHPQTGDFKKPPVADWTIMVYVNAKNNLENAGLMNVNQMEKVGSSDKVKIAVELGRLGNSNTGDAHWKGSRRYIIAKDKDTNKITSPVLQSFAKADMGDWNHLVDFVQWARQTAPARHTMLIVWNHGSGWDTLEAGHRRGQGFEPAGISYDDETGNHISTPDLGKALAASGKVDIYASDACLMQMAEVDYQLKDYADYIVGSEETEPSDGYTYDALLSPLASNPSISAAEVAKIAVRTYFSHYKQDDKVTQSAVRVSALPRFVTLLDKWSSLVMEAGETAVVKQARDGAQSFAVSDNKDLYDFVDRVGKGTSNAAIIAKGEELKRFLKENLILENAASRGYAGAVGLAIYLPDSSYNSDYNELSWAKDSSWGKFVQWSHDLK